MVAALLLAANALDAAWTVLPSVDPHDLNAWWLAPLVFAGMGLMLFGGLFGGSFNGLPAALRRDADDRHTADTGGRHAP